MRLLPFLLASALPSTVMAEAAPIADAGGSVVQMLIGLLAVLAMMVGSLWLLKRLTMPRGPTSGLMRVIAGAAVGQRERVVLLEVGAKWLVIGVAPGAVSMLAEVPREDMPPPAPEAGKDFAGWLKQVAERRYGSRP